MAGGRLVAEALLRGSQALGDLSWKRGSLSASQWTKLRLRHSVAVLKQFRSPPAPFRRPALLPGRRSEYYAKKIKFILFLTSPVFQNCLSTGCSLWGGGAEISVHLPKPWSKALQFFALSSQQTGMMLETVRRGRRYCLLFFSCTALISQTPSACGWLICSSSQEAIFFFFLWDADSYHGPCLLPPDLEITWKPG